MSKYFVLYFWLDKLERFLHILLIFVIFKFCCNLHVHYYLKKIQIIKIIICHYAMNKSLRLVSDRC